MFAVDWEAYPIIGGIIIIGIIVGALVVRSVMPFKLDITYREYKDDSSSVTEDRPPPEEES